MKILPACSTLLSMLLAIILCCSPAHASTQVATVVAVRGEVQAIELGGAVRKLAPKAAIYEKDTIKTGERGQVQILFTDNSIISLGRQSEMKVEEYRWQAGQKDGALKTKIKEGTFRVMGGALATSAPQNFKTETPTATIGIRGSMYAGRATATTLAVIFQGGKGIDVTNAQGTVAITRPGFGTRVQLDRPPLPPVKFETQDISELNPSKGSADSGADPGEEEAASSPEDGAASDAEESSGETTTSDSDTAGTEEPAAPQASTSSAEEGGTTSETTLSVGMEGLAPEPFLQETQPFLNTGSVFLDPSTSLIGNLQTDVVSNSSQTALATTVDQGAAAVVVDSTLSGRSYSFRREIDLSLPVPSDYHSTFLDYTPGTVTLTIYSNGEVTGALSDGTTFGPYLISGYDPAAASYSGYAQISSSLNLDDPTLGTIPLTVTTFADQTGQFLYNTFYAPIENGTPDSLLASLLFAGTPSTSSPANRIDDFSGHLLYTAPDTKEANLESMKIEVNYYNKRLIGRTTGDPNKLSKDSAIFFGTVDNSGTANFTILSSGTPGFLPADVTSAFGTGSAQLYGNFHQGLAFVASGNDYSIINDAATSTWSASGAAIRSPDSEIISSYPSAPIPFKGFVAGVADDTGTGFVSRILMNELATEFTMSADPTTGVVSGSITARDLVSFASGYLTSLTVGGTAARSAYVLNDQMVAILSGSNLTLRDYGNFLVTADPDAQQIIDADVEYLTWGTWELAYTDWMDASRDHLFSSQSFWVAGQTTPTTYISANLLGQPITGYYNGNAFGVSVDASGQNATPLTNGTTQLQIKFGTAVPSPVTGTISFDQAVLTIDSNASTVGTSGFTAYVSNPGVGQANSSINGAFYGPNAEAAAGNFRARLPSGVGLYGIFGGHQ